MKLTAFLPLALCACFYACDNSSKPSAVDPDDEPVVSSSSAVAVDYSKGRAMNKRLGKGINLGNSWDSNGSGADGDCGWNNCIKDEYFEIIAKAGFNSIRLPVRWQTDSDYGSHTVDPDKLEGVKEDVRLATKNGLAVILDFHHYTELFEYGSDFAKGDSLAGVKFYKEKDHFIAMWAQVAKEFDKEFPDSLLVFDVMNEPTISNADLVNDLTMSAYEVIRKNAPGKTIMFEAYHAAKFIDLAVLKLPEDGNIIYSGHYYEPYNYSHQGHSYACKGDEAYSMTAGADFKSYVATAKKYYPDKNGGFIPMNMGEFGISGQTGPCGKDGPSDKYKAFWAREVINVAESYEISWHYWGFVGVGGFEAYDRYENKWLPGFPDAFGFKAE